MKLLYNNIIHMAICLLALLSSELWASGGVAVVKAKFDDIEHVLTSYRIKFDRINFKDLEQLDLCQKYDAIFIPSGCEEPLESKLNIEATKRIITSVSLKPHLLESDKKLIARNIKEFIGAGGRAYFSGYSYEILQEAFGILRYHEPFPYMGMPGRIESDLIGDLSRFSLKTKLALYMTFPGWIALKSARNSEVISRASYETPRGERSGPISFICKKGKGEFIFTSYYSTIYSDFRRFNVYRVAASRSCDPLIEEAIKWGRSISGKIIDALHQGEYSRVYYFDLKKGKNSINFSSQKNLFQIDIFDREMSLIESRDLNAKNAEFSIISGENDFCFVKVYPSSAERYDPYALISSSGGGFLPYPERVTAAVTLFGVALALYLLKKYVFRKKYSGRSHLLAH